ncbi:hypothetical protein ACH347_36280 [Saccharopolyspora sp. 5N102]|uniref:hypothetical protein n=1 Tax=Saccharopolyspora sp. 5N102 TaxID=3375155 RepID=UPI0037A7E1D9
MTFRSALATRSLGSSPPEDRGQDLKVVVWAARDDEIFMHFEGQAVSSKDSVSGVASTLPMDLDPVSLLVVPHLDRIYAEMGRRCADRPGDPHRWVNPEFHGWWAARGFWINVEVATGKLVDLGAFLRQFHASYHPSYNGGQSVIHPQPAGVAVTDSAARYVGWHSITILRVAPDPQDVMRVYFFNPNNDSGQDWGDGVVVSAAGKMVSGSVRPRCRSTSSPRGSTSSTPTRSSAGSRRGCPPRTSCGSSAT